MKECETSDLKIARFMDYQVAVYGGVVYFCDCDGSVDFTNNPTRFSPLEKWDDIMPVVYKIGTYRRVYPDEVNNVCECKLTIKLECLYRNVIQFIDFIDNNHLKK